MFLNFSRTVKVVPALLLTGLLTSFVTGCGTSFVYPDNGVIPRAFFGMTLLDSEHVNPPLDYGTTRTWDSLPMLDWAEVNFSAGVYDFERLHAKIQSNQARAVDVIYTFGRTPE